MAYDSTFLCELAKDCGFSSAEVWHRAENIQQLLVCRRWSQPSFAEVSSAGARHDSWKNSTTPLRMS